MALNWIEGVMQNSRAKLGDRLLMIALADHADPDRGECYPSIKRLCKVTLLSERSVQTNIKRLVKMGELAVDYHASRYGTNLYRLNRKLLIGTAEFAPTPAEFAGVQISQGVQNTAKNHTKIAPKPSLEPSIQDLPPTSVNLVSATAEKPKRSQRLPDDWKLSDIETAYAKSQGLSPSEIAEEADKFRDHWLSKGETRADWTATWRNWVRNSKTFNRPRANGNGRHIPSRDNVMTGDGGWFDESEDNPFRGKVVRAMPQ